MATLAVIGVILVYIILFQIGRVSESLSAIRGEDVTTESGNRLRATFLLGFLVLFFAGIAWSVDVYWESLWPKAASKHGEEIDRMFWITTGITGVVFIICHILLFWFPYKYRARKGHVAQHFAHDNKLELIWTGVPAIVLTILVAYGIQEWNEITGPPEGEYMVVELTAKQFDWTVRYPGADGELGAKKFKLISDKYANPLGVDITDSASADDFLSDTIYLIKGVEVLFVLNARDVLHSMHFADFRAKQDCVPGIPTSFKLKPIMTTEEARVEYGNPEFNYELACAELCGSAHYNMRKVLKVVTQDEYDIWFAKDHPLLAVTIAEGEAKKKADEEKGKLATHSTH